MLTAWRRNCFQRSSAKKTPHAFSTDSTWQAPCLQGKKHQFLKKPSETTTHKGDWEKVGAPGERACCQLYAACRRGWAQVCSSAYCSLAWVNKEKTGAIRRACQPWNSLLVFTPFTLGLSHRCCLSPDFWQGTTAIYFLVKVNRQFQQSPTHRQVTWSPWAVYYKKTCPRTTVFKGLYAKATLGLCTPLTDKVLHQSTRMIFVMNCALGHHLEWFCTSDRKKNGRLYHTHRQRKPLPGQHEAGIWQTFNSWQVLQWNIWVVAQEQSRQQQILWLSRNTTMLLFQAQRVSPLSFVFVLLRQ